jgi:alpha-L-fucosidase
MVLATEARFSPPDGTVEWLPLSTRELSPEAPPRSSAKGPGRAQQFGPECAKLRSLIREYCGAMSWLRSAPLGLFIHYGPSSALAQPSDSAWWEATRSPALLAAAERFAPSAAVVDGWIALAGGIGASYITVVAKHHDGFALWPTRVSRWAVQPTEDVIGRVIRKGRDKGLRVFVYYSLLDWHEPTYKRDSAAYFSFVEAQLRELLTWYGPTAGVWFDGSWDHGLTDTELELLFAEIHRLQPRALVADNGHATPLRGEDFQIFEGGLSGTDQAVGNAPVSDLPLQAAVKLGSTWFWSGRPEPTSTHLLTDLCREAAATDVSLLVNVAPDPDGRIPASVVAALTRDE